MASTVKVPLLGTHSKGTVIGVTIGGVTVAGFLIWRSQKKSQKQSAAAAEAQNAAQQAGYGSYGYGSSGFYPNGYYGYGEPGITYGYGASGGFNPGGYYGYGTPTPTSQGVVTTNAQWDQAAISQLQSEGYNPQLVSAALGKYLLGQAVTSDQQTIIQAAIGIEGYPPQSGTGANAGFPPGIKTGPSPGQGGKKEFIDAPGKKSLAEIGAEHGDSRAKIDRLNPKLLARYGPRDIPKGTDVRIK